MFHGCLTAQYALDNCGRRAPIRDCMGRQDWKLGAKATDRVDSNTTVPIRQARMAYETRFGVCVKGASRQVVRFENLTSPANGFYLSVTGNIVPGLDAFDPLGDHGAVANNDRAHRRFTALASDSGQLLDTRA
jgi:hypothetical protein